jgi:DNA-binding response OmpR family regulator
MFEKWKNRRPQKETYGDLPLSVLVITASGSDAAVLREILAGSGWELKITDDLEDAVAFHGTRAASIVLFDRDLPGVDWREAVRKLANGHSRVILASFVADDYLWEEVIHCGGYDVLAKPFRKDEVTHTIQFAWAALTKSLPSAPHTR